MPNITRRRAMIVTGASLTATLTAVAASMQPATAAGPSPIRVLFEQWQHIQNHLADDPYWDGLSVAESNEAFIVTLNGRTALEREILALPVRDPGDFAMKVVVAIGDPEWDEMAHGERILADARAVIAQAA